MPPEQPKSYQPQPDFTPTLTPIYQMEAWYSAKGSITILGQRRCLVVVYPGWVVIYRPSDHAELNRIRLTPDLKMRYIFDYVRFSTVEGKKIGWFNTRYLFSTAVRGRFIFVAGVLVDVVANVGARSSDAGDRNLPVQLIALIIMLIGFGLIVAAIPINKAFIAACKRGAGIA